jgi:hypothetical protein
MDKIRNGFEPLLLQNEARIRGRTGGGRRLRELVWGGGRERERRRRRRGRKA